MHAVVLTVGANEKPSTKDNQRGDGNRPNKKCEQLKTCHERSPRRAYLAPKCSTNAHKSQTIPDAMTMGSDGMAGPIPYIEAATGAKTPIVRNEVEARSN